MKSKILCLALVWGFVLIGCTTSSNKLLVGTWRESGSTNTIEFKQKVVTLAPILKFDYGIQGSRLVLKMPANIVIEKLDVNIQANRTDLKNLQFHYDPPFTNWIVPFRVTPQELEVTWNKKTTKYERVLH